MSRRRRINGNAGAALGALLPLAVGAAALLQNPARTDPASAPQPVLSSSPAPPPAAMAAPVTAISPTPPDAATPQCLARFTIDRPRQRGTAVRQRETIICRRGYVLALNVDRHAPDWVMERLRPDDLKGPASRSDAFQPDPLLPAWADASSADYLHADYDRGHQAPAGDAKFAQTVMDQSFYLSNVAPQVGIGFNRGVWKALEETVRGWVTCGGHPDLHVITGPIYAARPQTIGDDRVAVPAAFFKIVYETKTGRAVGFVMPNRKIGSRIPDLQVYVKSIASIEGDTGLNFFASLDQRRQAQLKDQPGIAWGHVATCPGDDDD